jgi:hypothetical protein
VVVGVVLAVLVVEEVEGGQGVVEVQFGGACMAEMRGRGKPNTRLGHP